MASKYLDFCYTKFARNQRSQFNSNMLHKLLFAMEVLERCLSYLKSYFQLHQWSSYFLMPISKNSRAWTWAWVWTFCCSLKFSSLRASIIQSLILMKLSFSSFVIMSLTCLWKFSSIALRWLLMTLNFVFMKALKSANDKLTSF